MGSQHLDSQHSRHQAARCLQLAEEAPTAKLKTVLLAQSQAWNSLAEDQEWLEQRTLERHSHDALAIFPTIRAMLAGRSGAPPSRRPR
jgi:hypothetical protein